MTGVGHTRVGAALSLSVGYLTYNELTNNNIYLSLLVAFFVIIGATAPDWLEIRKKDGGTIIRHRTITHWVPLWIVSLFFSYYLLIGYDFKIDLLSQINHGNYFSSILFGFSIGGIIHLIVDFPNPMGIPILTPYHRFSLHLWKSGKYEGLLVGLSLIISLFYIGVSSEIITVDFSGIKF